jgi:predicted DsbA family dithiol-disulfide isomerase
MIRLDIFSDPICPWCAIGKAHLDRALEARPDHPFAIVWHPFQLNPDMPAGGIDRQDYLALKFGADRVGPMNDSLRQAARTAGIELDPDRPPLVPNTLDAHRLIHWAGIEGRQTAVVAALMRAYWREGRDIGAHPVLVQIASEAGLDGTAIARLLASEADAEEIRARDAHARARGVTGVPCFVVAHRHVVTGAQPTDLWLSVIDELTEGQNGRNPSPSSA